MAPFAHASQWSSAGGKAHAGARVCQEQGEESFVDALDSADGEASEAARGPAATRIFLVDHLAVRRFIESVCDEIDEDGVRGHDHWLASYDGWEVIVRRSFCKAPVRCRSFDPRFDLAADNQCSQYGENGLIGEALRLVGCHNRWCFEVGASDGYTLSNTLPLREQGWKAVLAEADAGKYAELKRRYGDVSHVVHDRVSSLDELLSKAGAPRDIDVGIIDVDGQDYWLWHSMVVFRPRVLLIEYQPEVGTLQTPSVDYLVPECGEGQSGIRPFVKLGESRGYKLVARTYCNLLFIDAECLPPL